MIINGTGGLIVRNKILENIDNIHMLNLKDVNVSENYISKY